MWYPARNVQREVSWRILLTFQEGKVEIAAVRIPSFPQETP